MKVSLVCVSSKHMSYPPTTTPFAVVVKDDHEKLKSRYQRSAVAGYDLEKLKMSGGNFIGTLLQRVVKVE